MDFGERKALLSLPIVGITMKIHPNIPSDQVWCTSVPIQVKKYLRFLHDG